LQLSAAIVQQIEIEPCIFLLLPSHSVYVKKRRQRDPHSVKEKLECAAP
jgi:hypothetical protein